MRFKLQNNIANQQPRLEYIVIIVLMQNCTQVNTPRRSSEAVISTSGETDREISAVGESGGYENEVSLRGLKEGELVPNQDIPTKVLALIIKYIIL